jgi:hypothetical protein
VIAQLFELYATETYSLKKLTAEAKAIGLTHPRSGRAIMKAEVHRLLQNPIYYGDFIWLDVRYQGSHEPLITRERFDQVQAVLRRKPRARYPKQRHAFMGLLRCALCGCTITAEKKKGKYVYYRCTGFHGACGNTYIREERLADLLGGVIKPIQITHDIAEDIATALRAPALKGNGDVLAISATWISDGRPQPPSSIAATTISYQGRFPRISGRGSRRNGRRNSRPWRPNERDLSRLDPSRPLQPPKF